MAADESIEPFSVEVPEKALVDLRERLSRARLPERESVSTSPGTADADWRQGVPLAYLSELADHWATGYDWRRCEAALNAFEQGRTRIFDLGIHFLHVRSPRPDARPLVLTHGWPSSVIEPLEVAEQLANPPRESMPAFHVVAPSLPGFGFSDKPSKTGWSVEKTADAWAVLMSRLSYERFVAAGGDWGGRVATALGVWHPDRVDALHTFTPYVREPDDEGELTEEEKRALAATREFWRTGAGYSLQQSTRPQTLAYGLSDSPVAQLAWIVEKFQGWTDCDGHPENAISRDRILDMVSLYWLTGTAGSSARFYWENHPPTRRELVKVPSAVSIFPGDMERLPRAWVEQRYRDLRYWHEADRGGHFPMLEVPESYVDELRHAFAAMLP